MRGISLSLNGYTGNISVDDNTLFYPKENFKLKLDTGFHFINTGATAGGFENSQFTSYISFHINKDRKIDSLINKNSAEIIGNGKGIKLKTVPVVINPGGYPIKYFLSSFRLNNKSNTDTSKIILIASQIYTFDNGALVGYPDSASSASFSVDSVGKVTSLNPASAFVNDKNQLQFIVNEDSLFHPWKKFGIDPSYDVFYSTHSAALKNKNGINRISYINNLITAVKWLNDSAQEEYRYFKLPWTIK